MSLFKSKNQPGKTAGNRAALAEIALNSIHDGVVMTDGRGTIQFINPAAVTMTECETADKAIGLDYGLIIRIESKEGRELPDNENPLVRAMKTNQPLEKAQVALICTKSNKRIPIAISVHSVEGSTDSHIITFRDIARELEEEGEQAEFISTASHEMRTPVATIDGYLSLALNPKTSTIDERARGYLSSAQAASKHLGKLFQNLLDITKLDDGRIRPHFMPVEMIEEIKIITDDYVERAKQNKITFNYGSSQKLSFDSNRRLAQVVYSFVDRDFLREVMDNLIENALKYTPEGGSVYVNVRGDGDRVVINVTDTGIGISADDLDHIFQKFYRADNSDTREIGGTGLGLYLVKQRVEAMGGKVWAESAFGDGSTFYVSLPRLTEDEYNKRMIAVQNQDMIEDKKPPVIPPITVAPAAEPTAPANPATPPQPAAPTASADQANPSPTPAPTVAPSPAPSPTPTPVTPPVPVTPPAPTTPAEPKPATPAPTLVSSSPVSTPNVAPAPAPAPAAAQVVATPPVSPTANPTPISPPQPSAGQNTVSSPPPAPPTTNPVQQNINNNVNGEAK